MCTFLAKLAIGLSATAAAGFYHLAAAPPALAATDVCGPGNFSSVCVPDNSPSPQSPATEPDPQPTSPAIVDPVQPPVVESPAIVDPVQPSVVQPTPPPIFADYKAPAPRATTIPEPGTVAGLLLIGAGIIYSGRKRNKQVGQQR
ncbi:MAG: PEP-CTERM sorting domain-containing protein [Microcoleus sp. CSU_2_2]|nr:PEP-CTERM sorting domain-containing protein [Microcoleus sp. SU_5_3]NJS10350.1 PEP-CTERM sorting domain-containing protein [Microcoleus sp. CSU_2_2]